MKRLVLLSVLVLAAAACGPSEAPSTTGEPESVANSPEPAITVTIAGENTGESSVPDDIGEEATLESEVPVGTDEEATTTVEKPVLPTGRPTEVRAQDHVLGATSPVVTIIEYGDFQ